MRRLPLLVMLAYLLTLSLIGCSQAEQVDKADRIVVDCAETIIWEFLEMPDIETGTTGYSHPLFGLLISDDIYLFCDSHPHKDIHNYIEFKADYYRGYFDWGELPPERIVELAGVNESY